MDPALPSGLVRELRDREARLRRELARARASGKHWPRSRYWHQLVADLRLTREALGVEERPGEPPWWALDANTRRLRARSRVEQPLPAPGP